MTEPRRPASGPERKPAARKPWRQPTVTVLAAGSAELAGAGSDDGVDLS